MSNPLLSVCLITYNHAGYIEQAIQSIISQQVNFTWEVIIADDCSTDGTREIVEEWAKRYPQLIRLILQNPNVGAAQNFADLLDAAKGKYIAYLEGDDYWTSQHKLQKQVDFLEANPDFAICFHHTKVIYEDRSSEPHLFNSVNQREVTTFEDLARNNYIQTGSCVYRNKLFGEFPDWYSTLKLGDWTLHLLNAQYGKIKFINEVMAVYRVHVGGAWSMKSQKYRYVSAIETLEVFKKYFYPRGQDGFDEYIAEHSAQLCFEYFEEGLYKDYRLYYLKYLKAAKQMHKLMLARLTLRYLLSTAEIYKAKLMKQKI